MSSSNSETPNKIITKASEIIKDFNKEETLHLIEYLSDSIGLNADNNLPPDLKILVGSHSGNSKKIAALIEDLAQENNAKAKVVNMEDYKPRSIKEESNLLIIVSTHGEGEPPATAEELYQFLGGRKVGDLSKINFAVIALGDSSYKYYCQAGIDFFDYLEKHGAKALTHATLLDVDFEENIQDIASSAYELFRPYIDFSKKKLTTVRKKRKRISSIYLSEILDKRLLNKKGSNKETYHLELSLEDSEINYQPGDALEVYPINDENLVEALLKKLGFDGNETITIKNEQGLLKEALTYRYELTVITIPVLKKLAEYTSNKVIKELINAPDQLDEFLRGTDLLDFFNSYSITITAQQLVDALRILPPRAYSISSAQSDVGNEVHLTVAPVRYNKYNRAHNGVASTYFADRLKVGENIGIKLKSNDAFRLPKEDEALIMIGPGTGIAPFRSFLQERVMNNHSGKNWLFFGDQHKETDFLYENELLAYKDKGVLHKMDLAFSRDQEQKVYVQDRLIENSKEVHQWLTKGAHIYVCGDKNHMAKDVKEAFVKIMQKHDKLSHEDATEQINQMRKQKRYQEDVY